MALVGRLTFTEGVGEEDGCHNTIKKLMQRKRNVNIESPFSNGLDNSLKN